MGVKRVPPGSCSPSWRGSTVRRATHERIRVLIAGLAATLADVFSTAAGESMSSKRQREIFEGADRFGGDWARRGPHRSRRRGGVPAARAGTVRDRRAHEPLDAPRLAVEQSEIFLLGAFAGIAGSIFGTFLPGLLGVAGVSG